MWKRTPQDWESRAWQGLASLCTISVHFVPKENNFCSEIFLSSLSSNQNEISASGFAESGKKFAQSE